MKYLTGGHFIIVILCNVTERKPVYLIQRRAKMRSHNQTSRYLKAPANFNPRDDPFSNQPLFLLYVRMKKKIL